MKRELEGYGLKVVFVKAVAVSWRNVVEGKQYDLTSMNVGHEEQAGL